MRMPRSWPTSVERSTGFRSRSVKAALEAVVGYLAYELGPKGIRLPSRRGRSRRGRPRAARTSTSCWRAFLCSPFARLITGGTIYVDGGYNIRG